MKLHTLRPAAGSIAAPKRIGRGGARGGTSGRGHNGAKSRSGYSSKRGFEGGQMPLQRRIPKFGFKNINRVEYKPVNLFMIQDLVTKFGVSVITAELLQQKGIISRQEKYKVLSLGELTSKVEVHAHSFSASAKTKIEAAKGKIFSISCGTEPLVSQN